MHEAVSEEPYEVFGRGRQDSGLWYLGMIRAVRPEDAEVFAYATFDEQNWLEMLVVPRHAIVDVVAPS